MEEQRYALAPGVWLILDYVKVDHRLAVELDESVVDGIDWPSLDAKLAEFDLERMDDCEPEFDDRWLIFSCAEITGTPPHHVLMDLALGHRKLRPAERVTGA